ncbi:MAG: hypothetical protein HYW56_00805, partial [Candidatus Harrisonbacteria bacterium]|nr:hypothetical protein [Candidatus Harrisonbacteria bacterium]
MCGIAGYAGPKNGLPIVLNSLRRLEYRGYDSAGVAFAREGRPRVVKSVGKLGRLETALARERGASAGAVIGHTRWATHGEPTEANAHPHADCAGKIFVVHNGIIENYRELKDALTRKGHVFSSETDTEVVPHLIEEHLKKEKEFSRAFAAALAAIRGAYALAVLYAQEPDTLYFARLGSPLILGLGNRTHLKSTPRPRCEECARDARRDEEFVATALQLRGATPQPARTPATQRDTANCPHRGVAPPRSIAGDTPSVVAPGAAGQLAPIAARDTFEMGSEYFLASDPAALAGVAREVVYLKDGQRGMLTPKGYTVHPSKPKIELLDIDPETVKKGPYPHFMLKEI